MRLLPTLPNRFPDEWYLSYLYRLHLLSGNPNLNRSIDQFFGKHLILSHVLPTGVEELVARLPSIAGLTVEKILAENTILPYLRPFALHQDADAFISDFITNPMQFGQVFRKPGKRLGLHIREPRFCSDCLREDAKTWGLAYFHRSHQIPEVVICAFHGIVLRTACTKCGPLPWSANFLWEVGRCRKCGESLADQITEPALFKNRTADLQISNMVTRLLVANLPTLDQPRLRATYRHVLAQHGLMLNENKVKSQALTDAVAAKYGVAYMAELGATLYSLSTHTPLWATHFFNSRPVRPLDHCILICFLFGNLENFLRHYLDTPTSESPDSFVEGACEEYSQNRVYCDTWETSKEMSSTPGIDEIARSFAEKEEVPVSFEAAFKAGWSKDKISKHFGVNFARVVKFAKLHPDLESTRARKLYDLRFAKHRSTLENFLSRRPNGTLQQFKAFRGTRQDWLDRNEPDWLLSQFARRSESKDDDAQFEASLKEYVEAEFLALKPRRISASRILRELSFSRVFRGGPTAFPRTWEALQHYTETPEKFRVRLLTTAYSRAENKSGLTADTLSVAAGIKKDKLWQKSYAAAVAILSDEGCNLNCLLKNTDGVPNRCYEVCCRENSPSKLS